MVREPDVRRRASSKAPPVPPRLRERIGKAACCGHDPVLYMLRDIPSVRFDVLML